MECLISHMIQRDATQRESITWYLSHFRGIVFPSAYYLLHGYISDVSLHPPEEIVRTLYQERHEIMKIFSAKKWEEEERERESREREREGYGQRVEGENESYDDKVRREERERERERVI